MWGEYVCSLQYTVSNLWALCTSEIGLPPAQFFAGPTKVFLDTGPVTSPYLKLAGVGCFFWPWCCDYFVEGVL